MSTRWKGTIALEGELDRDCLRKIDPGAINYDFLPIPLLRPAFTEEVAGVEVNRRPEACGEVEMIQREQDTGLLIGTGWIDDDVLVALLTSGDFPHASLGVGVVLDQATSDYEGEVLVVHSGILHGLQITKSPAFPTAAIRSVA